MDIGYIHSPGIHDQTALQLRRYIVMPEQTSVIAYVRAYFAAKYPIGPAGIHQDHRQEHECSDQQKRLRSLRRRGLPQGEMVGHDHRIKTDSDADIG